MKKIKELILEHLTLILLFLILSIIPLYVLFFNQRIDKETINTISNFFVSIAAVISVVFLYLAFKESRLNNILKINESEFTRLENRVKKIEELVQKPIYSEKSAIEINKFINYSITNLRLIKAMSFVNYFDKIISYLKENTKYLEFLSLQDSSELIEIREDQLQDFENMRINLNRIQSGLFVLFNIYLRIGDLYESIDKSNIIEPLKKNLVQILNEVSSEFTYLRNIEIEDKKIAKNFNSFKVILISKNKVYFSEPIIPSIFSEQQAIIKSIQEKYK